jgi:hypothetical protein
VTEWVIGCGRDLVAAKGVGGTTNGTHVRPGSPKAKDPREPFKPLLPGLLWLAKGLRGGDVAKVLV